MDQTLTSLDKSLSTLIDGATEKGAKLVDFLYEQAPEVIAQLLLWHGVESFVIFILYFAIFVGGVYGNVKGILFLKKTIGDDWKENPAFWMPTAFGTIIGQIIMLAVISDNMNLTWLKIWIAPKVYLLEYIANLTK